MIAIDGAALKDLLTVWGPLGLGWIVAGFLGFVVYKLVNRILDIQTKLAKALNDIAERHGGPRNDLP